MAVAFTRFSYWIWGGKEHEAPNSSLSSSSDFPSGFRELDSLKFPSANGTKMRSSRRTRKKWGSREERRIDREYDIVLVPSDGGCMSGSESDDSDWSVGWLEPHGPDFDSDTENSFAVLVPCYGRGRCESSPTASPRGNNGGTLGAVTDRHNVFSVSKSFQEWVCHGSANNTKVYMNPYIQFSPLKAISLTLATFFRFNPTEVANCNSMILKFMLLPL